MALNNTLRPSTATNVGSNGAASPAGAPAPSSHEVGATTSTPPASSTPNPIGTGTAKLLQGDTQEEDNALQLLKHDAYAVSIAQDNLAALQSGGGSASDIADAQQTVSAARTTYESDLSDATEAYALTSSRVNRYLTGGAHPVPDNALIPSSDEDMSDFLQSMTDGDAAAAGDSSPATDDGSDTDNNAVNSSGSGGKSDVNNNNNGSAGGVNSNPIVVPSPDPAPQAPVVDNGPGTVSYVDTTLSQDMQKHLATSSDVLSTSTINELTATGASTNTKVTSGDLTKNFTLFPSGTGTPSYKDINQVASADCYYLSALSSLAATPQGQQTIQDAISGPAQNGDYTVTLHSPSGSLVDIAVNPNNLPITSRGTPAFNTSTGNPNGANWVNLMEAAYAKYNDAYSTNTSDGTTAGLKGYDAIQEDDITDTTFNFALTGQTSTGVPLQGQSQSDVAKMLTLGLQTGQPVEAYNLDTIPTQSAKGVSIEPSHAYAVVGFSTDGATPTVTVRNPWGSNFTPTTSGENADGTFTMTLADFCKVFEQVNA